MNLLLFGSCYLRPAFERLGHRVFRGEDFLAPGAIEVDVREALSALAGPDRPDIIVVTESLGPRRLPLNLENAGIPRAFYALDPHLNLYWHRQYAAGFEMTFTTQKSTAAALSGPGRPAFWLPWAVDTGVIYDHGLPRTLEIAFVGRADPRFRPKRHLILEVLKERHEVAQRGERPDNELSFAEMGRFYSQARLVINEAIHGEANLRLFEAAAAGAMVLTEDIGVNLEGLFTPGLDLATYTPADLADKAAYYLAHEAERGEVARRGHARVQASHSLEARAREFFGYLGEERWLALPADPWPLAQTLYDVVRRGLYPVKFGLARMQHIIEERLQADAGFAPAWVLKAQVALLHRDLRGALAAWEQAAALVPADFHLRVVQGHLREALGEPEAAAAAYLAGLELAGSAAAAEGRELGALIRRHEQGAAFFTLWGAIYEAAGRWFNVGALPAESALCCQYAADYYEQAIRREPDFLPAIRRYGELLLKGGQPAAAAEFFRHAALRQPDNPEHFWLWGRAQLQSYQAPAGLKNLLQAQSLEPRLDPLAAMLEAGFSPEGIKALVTRVSRELGVTERTA